MSSGTSLILIHRHHSLAFPQGSCPSVGLDAQLGPASLLFKCFLSSPFLCRFLVHPCSVWLVRCRVQALALPARCGVQALALPARCRVQAFGPACPLPSSGLGPACPACFAERSCQAAHSLLPSGSAHGACTQNLVGSHVKIQAGVSSLYREAWSVCWLLPVMLGAATGRPSILGYRVVALIVSLFPFRN